MKMAGDWTRQFTKEFIELYRELTCLWKVKSDHYRDRVMRDRAYAKLVEKAKEMTPDADVNFVKKKLNILRTIFRKEHSKVKKSKESGSGQIFKPKLWCYEPLLFTADQDNTYVGESGSNDEFHASQNVVCNVEGYNEIQHFRPFAPKDDGLYNRDRKRDLVLVPSLVVKHEVNSENEDTAPYLYRVGLESTDIMPDRANTEEMPNQHTIKRSSSDDQQNYYWQLKKRCENLRSDRPQDEQHNYSVSQRSCAEEDLQAYYSPYKGAEVSTTRQDDSSTQFHIDPPLPNRILQPRNHIEERNCPHRDLLSLTSSHLTKKIDECDIFGYNVAMKLRNITDYRQKLFAEKLINDTLFEGQLGTLNVTSKIRTSSLSHTSHRFRSRSPPANARSQPSSPNSEPNNSLLLVDPL